MGSILVGSAPAPVDAQNRSAWRDPTVQEEFAAWSERLGAIGVRIGPGELQDAAWDFLGAWMRARGVAMTPFDRYQQITGTEQFWSMFVAPHRYPCVLHVDIKEPGSDWTPIYVARSDEYDWRRSQLDDTRFRSAIFRYGWPQFDRGYRQFAAWLAEQAARDFPEAVQLRVRMYKYKTPGPAELRSGRQPGGAFQNVITIRLDSDR